jgi:hypothetical protein
LLPISTGKVGKPGYLADSSYDLSFSLEVILIDFSR